MFHFLHKKNIIQLFFLIVILIITIYRIYFQDFTFHFTENSTYLYIKFVTFFQEHLFWLSVLIISNLALQLFLLHLFFKKNGFSDEKTFFPIIWYLIFLNVGFNLNDVSPTIFTNLLIIILLILNSFYTPTNIKNRILLSGIFIGIYSLIDIASFLLLILISATILVNKFSKIKDIFILFSATLVPYIYFFTILILTDSTLLFIESYSNISFFAFFSQTNFNFIKIIAIIIALSLLLVISSINKIHFDNKLIIYRKRFISLIFLLVTSLIMVSTSPIPLPYSLVYIFTPIVFNFSILHAIKSRPVLNDILVLGVSSAIFILEFI